MCLLVVTDKTAHFDTFKSICHVFAHERSLFRSDASVKWSAGGATCEGGCVCLCGCLCACVGACEGVCGCVCDACLRMLPCGCVGARARACVYVCVCVCVCV